MKAIIKLHEVTLSLDGQWYSKAKRPVACIIGEKGFINVADDQEYFASNLIGKEVNGEIIEDEVQDQYDDGEFARSATTVKAFRIKL